MAARLSSRRVADDRREDSVAIVSPAVCLIGAFNIVGFCFTPWIQEWKLRIQIRKSPKQPPCFPKGQLLFLTRVSIRSMKYRVSQRGKHGAMIHKSGGQGDRYRRESTSSSLCLFRLCPFVRLPTLLSPLFSLSSRSPLSARPVFSLLLGKYIQSERQTCHRP
jgi:hypothetical protein